MIRVKVLGIRNGILWYIRLLLALISVYKIVSL